MAGLGDKKVTVKEVCYILSIAGAFFANNYSLKMEIRELAALVNSEKRVVDIRLNDLEKFVTDQRERSMQYASSLGDMVEPARPIYETKKRKR